MAHFKFPHGRIFYDQLFEFFLGKISREIEVFGKKVFFSINGKKFSLGQLNFIGSFLSLQKREIFFSLREKLILRKKPISAST